MKFYIAHNICNLQVTMEADLVTRIRFIQVLPRGVKSGQALLTPAASDSNADTSADNADSASTTEIEVPGSNNHTPKPQALTEAMRWPYAELTEYLDGKRKIFTFPYQLTVTPFERRVYQGLLQIPYGQVSTYKDIAIGAGSPKGFRAVGQAAHKNPLPLLIPCHRVIGSNHKLTGFAGGLGVKEGLLKLEGYFLT